jgi:hypothetical protein
MKRKTIFVLAYASDPVTTTYLSYEVAENLTPAMARIPQGDGSSTQLWLFPEPAWSLSDYATQCQNDPAGTGGALVLYDVENDEGSFNFFFVQNTYAHLYAKAFFVNCKAYEPPFKSDVSGILSYSVGATFNGTPTSATPPYTDAVTTTHQNTSLKQTGGSTSKGVAGGNQAGTAFQNQQTTQDTLNSQKSSPPPATLSATATKSVIPTMQVLWLSSNEISSPRNSANQYGIPLFSIAALGAYLASRTYTQTTSITQTAPAVPGTSTTNGSISTTTQKSGNDSSLPYGLALAGSSLLTLSSITVGGANQTRVLKSAAAGVASELKKQIRLECADAWQNYSKGSAPPPDPDRFCTFFEASKF